MEIFSLIANVSFIVLIVAFFIREGYEGCVISKAPNWDLLNAITYIAIGIVYAYGVAIMAMQGVDFFSALMVSVVVTAVLVIIAYVIIIGLVHLIRWIM